jgi:hypothetical protein
MSAVLTPTTTQDKVRYAYGYLTDHKLWGAVKSVHVYGSFSGGSKCFVELHSLDTMQSLFADREFETKRESRFTSYYVTIDEIRFYAEAWDFESDGIPFVDANDL